MAAGSRAGAVVLRCAGAAAWLGALMLQSCCCCGIDGQEVTLQFEAYKRPNPDGGYPSLLLVPTDAPAESVGMHDNIDGFEFEWGYVHTVRVLRQRQTVMGEHFHTTHALIEVERKEPATDQTFSLSWMGSPWLEGGSSPRALMDGTRFDCAQEDVCARLDEEVGQGPQRRFTMTFRHTGERSRPLQLIDVNGGP